MNSSYDIEKNALSYTKKVAMIADKAQAQQKANNATTNKVVTLLDCIFEQNLSLLEQILLENRLLPTIKRLDNLLSVLFSLNSMEKDNYIHLEVMQDLIIKELLTLQSDGVSVQMDMPDSATLLYHFLKPEKQPFLLSLIEHKIVTHELGDMAQLNLDKEKTAALEKAAIGFEKKVLEKNILIKKNTSNLNYHKI